MGAQVSCKRVEVFVDQLDLHILVHRHKQHLCARIKARAEAAEAAERFERQYGAGS